MVAEDVLDCHVLRDGVFAHTCTWRKRRCGDSRRACEIILGDFAALDFVMSANEQGGGAAFDRFYPFSACAPKGYRRPFDRLRVNSGELGNGGVVFLDFHDAIPPCGDDVRIVQQLVLPVVGDVAGGHVAVSSPLGDGVVGVGVAAQRGDGMSVGRVAVGIRQGRGGWGRRGGDFGVGASLKVCNDNESEDEFIDKNYNF